MQRIARKGFGREDQSKSLFGVRNILGPGVDDRIGSADERLLNEPNPLVVEHPHAQVAIGSDHKKGVGHDGIILARSDIGLPNVAVSSV